MAVTRRRLETIRSSRPKVDRGRVLATSDAEIEAMIAADPETAPDVSDYPTLEPKALRLALGMTQEAFADMLAVPVGTLRNWEQHRTPPDPAARTLFRLMWKDLETMVTLLKEARAGR
jgi:putative transcriptional regulator